MTAAVIPSPWAFMNRIAGVITPTMPNAMHCAAIHALLVHTRVVNEPPEYSE